jgi:4-hydroxy-tetrahydrodipicolinate reductase
MHLQEQHWLLLILSMKQRMASIIMYLTEVKEECHVQQMRVRGGTIVGEHEIIFAGTDEVIEFKHTAYSRAVFGKGAVEAAVYLADKPAGLYDMQDVIAAK